MRAPNCTLRLPLAEVTSPKVALLTLGESAEGAPIKSIVSLSLWSRRTVRLWD
jgi:hypothetical protein